MATLSTPRLGIPYPDGAERVMDGDNAMGAIANKIDGLGLPFAQSAGVGTVNMANTGGATLSVTFPAARFTQPPLMSATVAAGSNNFFASIFNPTTTGFVLYCSHRDSQNTASAIQWQRIAVQMLPGAAPGRAAPEVLADNPRAVVVCHTPGCAAEGEPVVVDAGFTDLDGNLIEITQFGCGVCGQAITDVTDAGDVELPGNELPEPETPPAE